ncbi:MAG: tRNA-dihydrouridine synthase family protein [Bdellovibrionaceae bacterium]|nr:tRNA-dihydrouridine synthase family protein [Pseudobdellovibrionaceae bacterium]
MTTERRALLGGKVNFPLCLAPMVGLSHVVLRMILRSYLPAGAVTLWPTEMLNSRKLPFEDFARVPETYKGEGEGELVPQILGNEAEPIGRSIARLTDWGAEGIDINMGCPVQKALRHNYGVALMGDPGYASEVVAMARAQTKLPVSVKLRAGSQGDFGFLETFAKGLTKAGADWLTLHPRTPEQKRRGQADWSQIRRLRDSLDVPVIGNGDIQITEDVHRMIQETGCDQVMAGRALAARPWMMWQLGEELGFANPAGREGRAPRTREEEGAEYGRMLLQFLDLAPQYFTEEQALRKFRFFVRTTSVWLPFGMNLVSISTKERTIADIRRETARYFEQSIEMSARTELRQ